MLKLLLLEVLEVRLSLFDIVIFFVIENFLKLLVLFKFCEFICIVCRQYERKRNSAWLVFCS